MALTQDEVITILKMVEHAPVGRLSVQTGDLKLELVKGEPGMIAPRPVAGMTVIEASSPASALLPAAAASPAVIPPDGGGPTIKAPILGIFYRSPDPGADPYVVEGSQVEEDTTVALIEVMKLFNPVKAGVRGRIRRVLVENGALVEYQQGLFEIELA